MSLRFLFFNLCTNNKDKVIKCKYESEITNLYNYLSDEIIAMNKNELEDGIWKLISNINKDKFEFIKNGFKESYPGSQLIGPLNNKYFFSFEYISQYYCYNCHFKEETVKYVGPIIEINEADLSKNLTDCLYNKFRNKSMICKKCGYSDRQIITNLETRAEIILDIENPNVLFSFYELGKERDNFIGTLKNIRTNIDLIKNQIKVNILFKNDDYKLSGLICCL